MKHLTQALAIWISPLFFNLISGTLLPTSFEGLKIRRRDVQPTPQHTATRNRTAMLLPRAASADQPPSVPTSTPFAATYPADSQPITQAPIGAIFGGVIGGLLLVIACAIVFFYLQKRRKQKQTPSTQLTPRPIPKTQLSVHVEHIDDTSNAPQRASQNLYIDNDGSGDHPDLVPDHAISDHDGWPHQTNLSPLADSGGMGVEAARQKGVEIQLDQTRQ